jgi:L-fuculose-phosphate aldolase
MTTDSSRTESERSAREKLVQAYQQVCKLRLNEQSSGNVSCRFGDGMLISPAGASGDSISADTIVYIGADRRWNPAQRPSTEWQMHAAIYRDSPSANAVVHTHSDYCVAVASHNRPLPGFHYLVGVFGGGDVPCVPYSTFGSLKLAEDCAAALKTRSACLMSNHGMICRGGNLESAINLAHRLEIMCRQYVLARTLGEPSHLTEADWVDFFQRAKITRYSDDPHRD